MTDTSIQPAPQPAAGDLDGVKLVYILYFVSFVLAITAIGGLIYAYLKRGTASAVAASHYTWQIRTFWIGLLYSVLGALSLFFVIGLFILLATAIWFLVRSIKGFIAAGEGRPIQNVDTWFW
ncbi:hypothetical protein [Parvibaculum sp.]|uniref:DUF4870 family protein n=1 Tax=Parvibaculum sp. TaxID=2024848 RepID=UPI00320CBABD